MGDNGMTIHDEKLIVANAMINYGGSFVSNLGKALISADAINHQKIKTAFPIYWKKYFEMGKQYGDQS